MSEEYKKLSEYGLIGNLETCALVGRDGSIDWCCFPHLESASVFAAILDARRGGHFRIAPAGRFESRQAYRTSTNILETTFRTASGVCRLVDFMPVEGHAGSGADHQTILRQVSCLDGEVELAIDCRPRFDYARALPAVHRAEGGAVARWQDEILFLQIPGAVEVGQGNARARLSLRQGEHRWVVLRYSDSAALNDARCQALLDRTANFWLGWAHHCERDPCVIDGPWHQLATRSGLVLKLLTHPETGAIAAAPTTSLPEEIGGVRNWDYRYAWIRDASFTVQALHNLGHIAEAGGYVR